VKLEELRSEPTFLINLESSIAVGLGVIVDQVIVTMLEVGARRLQAELVEVGGGFARRLQNTALKVHYEVYMEGDAEKNRIKSNMEALGAKGDSAQAFQNELQAKEKESGRTVVVDSVVVASVDVVDRTESIDDAKKVAKEKATTTTSTLPTSPPAPAPTEEPVASATEAPATTSALYESGDELTAGAVSTFIPKVWLLILALLAISC
jgi:hypothetical protein